MTTIIVTHEDNEVDEFEFDADMQMISIGRRSTNDVCIPNLSVSGMHARLTIDGKNALIEDNNSTNGTYVNGRLIARQLLDPNDEIVIGKTRVTVALDASPHASSQMNASVAPTKDAYENDAASYEHNAQADLNSANAAASAAASTGITDSVANDQNPQEYGSDNQNLDLPVVDNAVRAVSKGPSTAELLAEESGGVPQTKHDALDDSFADDLIDDEPTKLHHPVDSFDDAPMSLSDKAKLALGRSPAARPSVKSVAATSANAAASRAFSHNGAVAETAGVVAGPRSNEDAVLEASAQVSKTDVPTVDEHPLDSVPEKFTHELEDTKKRTSGAVIEIQNGAKSGQVLPIDKPVTTLGRPGIQIAAIMRKPDGYFLMHIESDESVDMPTLNQDSIGDEPVMLSSGDRLNVAGIDVEFMLS